MIFAMKLNRTFLLINIRLDATLIYIFMTFHESGQSLPKIKGISNIRYSRLCISIFFTLSSYWYAFIWFTSCICNAYWDFTACFIILSTLNQTHFRLPYVNSRFVGNSLVIQMFIQTQTKHIRRETHFFVLK